MRRMGVGVDAEDDAFCISKVNSFLITCVVIS